MNMNFNMSSSHIPVERIIDKADSLFNQKNYIDAGKLLNYWKDEAIAIHDKKGELAMINELIGYYRKQNHREKCLSCVSRALLLTEELHQSDMVSGATIFINCATAYKAFDMAADSLPLFRKAEAIYQKKLSPNDSRLGGLYNNMALSLVELGNFKEAEKAYHTALSVMKTLPDREAECAITLVNMAHMYEDFSQSEKIKDCMLKAYELLQSEQIPHDGYYAFVLEKCAPAFRYFGYTNVYIKLTEEAKRIYERA